MKQILALILLLAACGVSTASATSSDQREGIESVAENVATVSTANGEMEISNPGNESMRFHIFSITGQMVKAVEVSSGERVTVDLPSGCYIVKCSQWSKKIVVR